jgi:23S rRNA (adenine2503-C2)-methyltransferase
MSLPDLERWLREVGEPPFRAKQLYHWLYGALAADFSAMANLPKPLREKLARLAVVDVLAPVAETLSHDRLTRKALLRLPDGASIESVLMIYRPTSESRARRTVCVSTQAGCAVGCPFCATGMAGLLRNLTCGEIVAQVLHFARQLRALYGPQDGVTNVVFMGQGEPLANLEAVWAAVEQLNSPYGFNLGARHMTISTVGLVPQIRALADKPLQVGLAISLHAPDDDLRSRLVPMNKRYPIAPLLEACREYVARTNRRITFEYALMAGVNDSPAQASQLASLLHGLLCHVNLIPLNDVAGSPFRAPTRDAVLAFQTTLQRKGVIATVRAEKGGHIDAACGQLRARRGGQA